MPKKKCGLGFSCGAIMLEPGLDPGDCPNYKTCGSASELTPEEEFELIRVREVEIQERENEWQRYQETVRLSRHQAAIMMLMARGCPQTLDSMEIPDILIWIDEGLAELRSRLAQFEGHYIAPEGCEAHQYNVKRPAWRVTDSGTGEETTSQFKRVYWYNKLTAQENVFEPSEKEDKVRVIHLSHDDDPRNLEARAGVDRRNQLTQLRTQLRNINAAIAEAFMLIPALTDSSSSNQNFAARTHEDEAVTEAPDSPTAATDALHQS